MKVTLWRHHWLKLSWDVNNCCNQPYIGITFHSKSILSIYGPRHLHLHTGDIAGLLFAERYKQCHYGLHSVLQEDKAKTLALGRVACTFHRTNNFTTVIIIYPTAGYACMQIKLYFIIRKDVHSYICKVSDFEDRIQIGNLSMLGESTNHSETNSTRQGVWEISGM